jgi:hypothetical protein
VNTTIKAGREHQRPLHNPLDGMARKATGSKNPTRPVRLHEDVADLAEKLAPIFGESVPDFLSARLRPLLQGLRAEAARLLMSEDRPEGQGRKKGK